MTNGKIGAEFLLAEFNAIQQRAIQIEQSKSSSINFYLVIVAAAIAGVSGTINLFPGAEISLLFFITSAFILVVGCLTLDHSINQAATIVLLYRRAGRIRRYFLEQSKDIEPYLPFQATDALPRIYLPASLTYRGAEVTVFVINIASISIMSAAIFSFLSWTGTAIVSIAIAGIFWLLQNLYCRRKLTRFEASAQRKVLFPMSLPEEGITLPKRIK